mmetsp:Transcript_892/g.2848  ORF Transcript_892/g.2848 Transcript_892/m.2848 type:complete len:224 (+) Transcript_892:168-839(+)
MAITSSSPSSKFRMGDVRDAAPAASAPPPTQGAAALSPEQSAAARRLGRCTVSAATTILALMLDKSNPSYRPRLPSTSAAADELETAAEALAPSAFPTMSPAPPPRLAPPATARWTPPDPPAQAPPSLAAGLVATETGTTSMRLAPSSTSRSHSSASSPPLPMRTASDEDGPQPPPEARTSKNVASSMSSPKATSAAFRYVLDSAAWSSAISSRLSQQHAGML